MFYLNHNPQVTELLGKNIHFDEETHPPVKGFANITKGQAELEFLVQGEKGFAQVGFNGHRFRKTDFWESRVFYIEKDGKRLDL